jgi:heat shock protein HslJ
MKARMLHMAGVAVLAVMGLAGLGRAQAAPRADALPPEVLDKPWALVSLQTAPGAAEDVTGKGLTIKFTPDSKVDGSGGCNGFFGNYTAGAAPSLTIGQLGATRKACEQPVMDLEAKYFAALETVESYKVDGSNGLQLIFDKGNGTLTYVAASAATMPATGETGDSFAALTLLAMLCVAAGVWLRYARPRWLAYAAVRPGKRSVD